MEWQEAYRIACFAQNYCEQCLGDDWMFYPNDRCFSLAYRLFCKI